MYIATFPEIDLGTLPHLRISSLQRLVMVGFTSNGQQYFHVAVVTGPSLQAKAKSDDNSLDLMVSGMISCFVDMFNYIFSKMPISFCFTVDILFHFENKFRKWKLVSLSISSYGILLTEATINTCSEKW